MKIQISNRLKAMLGGGKQHLALREAYTNELFNKYYSRDIFADWQGGKIIVSGDIQDIKLPSEYFEVRKAEPKSNKDAK